ncbi:MAG: transcriptional regulator [Kaistia sp. SCN 65-12]|jgi:transcriptional regulator with XRE-family HTH domain|uniref:helix-turn-helix domain-containing protein n=1 Tax=Hyphomicrobium sp. CS1BSMeth3 TaxID=1892844 RepID=UPI00086E97A7|nr:helix-turn-helix transcriptional regulator [Hyphomicrobium sp. CS1BSMeth3]ODT22638.1 MAG: transcriptional regulator [Kaistia sp. SCN 65-12]
MRDTLRSPRQIKLRKLLRDCREKRGLTQADVAARLNKPQSFVAKYEGGERDLSAIEFIDVVQALGLEPVAVMRQLLKVLDGDTT